MCRQINLLILDFMFLMSISLCPNAQNEKVQGRENLEAEDGDLGSFGEYCAGVSLIRIPLITLV